jgi:NAD(P)-dependent dehydrogenase (short-subunit alcohol dehydrogenase family)
MSLLDGRVVLVAGIGPGLGSALAERVVHHGGRVVVSARSGDRVGALAERLGDAAVGVVADVTERDQCASVVEAALDAFGRIDGLVYNAALIPPLTPVIESTPAQIRDAVAVGVEGALSLVQGCAPAMATAGGGSIVLVGSAVVRHPKPGFGAYNVGKHAALGLARSLALELGPDGIRVNTLVVGKIDGERLRSYLSEMADRQDRSLAEDEAEYVSRIALGRLPDPVEHADAAAFLLSPLSRSITGHMLDANGGEYFD